jgi:hypothetical protein
MSELKGTPAPGPFSVIVTFVDGSKLTVIDKVSDEWAVDKYNEYVRGIGARVGTTRKVTIMTDLDTIACEWMYYKSMERL